jgi:preprotein translocase subunit SecA
MFSDVLKKIFGSRNDRLLKQYRAQVNKINALEATMKALPDEGLRAKTAEFKSRFEKGETLDPMLPEAYAVVREAGVRVLGMRHFDSQLIGGIALHNGKIAEQRTGEGKTLTSTLPAYLNAISGKGVHIVTVNDYLASRDAEWMGRLHKWLGLTVGVILSQQPNEDKQAAYAADITYGTNNEFGFDYLRDNMEYEVSGRRQRGLAFAIVDEVDSILIDEARTPLIISGQADDNVEMYYRVNDLIPKLTRQEKEDAPGDFYVDEKGHQVHLSEMGHEHAEKLFESAGLLKPGTNLYDAQNISLMHHLYAGLRAHALYHRDQHYVVQEGEVVIVDEFTGRLMSGRRWSDGLHQAVEAKEGQPIQRENQTLASITFQNFFRLYTKLSGMTGTADTEAYEFQQIYNLETVIIPTHRPMVRKDQNDYFYRSANEKYKAVVRDIQECYERGQPVLVGTTSIENSELIAKMLEKENLPHQVLNAKQHAREAMIVANAGRPKMITIATNMAGRGTDIVLGGALEPALRAVRDDDSLLEAQKEVKLAEVQAQWNGVHEEVKRAGGLRIVATERHESRRIDNQLRGRSGRQGDPGSTRFYLSAEDPLIRIFGGDRMAKIMTTLKIPENEPIDAKMMTRQIEKAQLKVEQRNFDIRKQLLEYDDVANDQRKAIYEQRNEILDSKEVKDTVTNMIGGLMNDTVSRYVPAESVEEQWDVPALEKVLHDDYQLNVPIAQLLKDKPDSTDEDIRALVNDFALKQYHAKRELAGDEVLNNFERAYLLQSIDTHWREHLSALDHLRQGIHLRGYAQKNPKQEYKREAFEMFSSMLDRVKADVVRVIMTVQVRTQADVEKVEEKAPVNVQYHHSDFEQALADANAANAANAASGQGKDAEGKPFERAAPKLGRNDPCFCGSGKKYKQCHGNLSA